MTRWFTLFTIVEAELDGETDDGLLVTRAGGGWTKRTSRAKLGVVPRGDDVDDELAAVGGPDGAAEAVLSGRSREALLDLDEWEIVYVGDAEGVLTEAEPHAPIPAAGPEAEGPSRLASWLRDEAGDRIPADASTVRIETELLVLDGDRLKRQARAVAAVADAFEEARAGKGPADRGSGAS